MNFINITDQDFNDIFDEILKDDEIDVKESYKYLDTFNFTDKNFQNIFDEILNINDKQMAKKHRQRRILIYNERKRNGKISFKNMYKKMYPQKICYKLKKRDSSGRFSKRYQIKIIPISALNTNFDNI
jgi:hypothetical protein